MSVHFPPPAGGFHPVAAGDPAPPPSTPPSGAAPGIPPSSSSVAVGQPDLPGTQPGGSIASVLECRLKQIAMGHTPEQDLLAPDCWLENAALHFIERAKRDRQRARTVTVARDAYVKAAAVLLAAIDRIDMLATHPNQESTNAG